MTLVRPLPRSCSFSAQEFTGVAVDYEIGGGEVSGSDTMIDRPGLGADDGVFLIE